VAAISGLSMVYYGSYMSIFPIWGLEIGGIVHHLKHASEVLDVGTILIQMVYHVIYLSSRVLLTINVYNGFIWIRHSEHIVADLVGLTIACVLIVQNIVWWIHNVKKDLK